MKGVWWCIAGLALAASAAGQSGGELRFGLRADPKTLDPLLGAEEASETVAYLTSGVLIRLIRVNLLQTMQGDYSLKQQQMTQEQMFNVKQQAAQSLQPVRFGGEVG